MNLEQLRVSPSTGAGALIFFFLLETLARDQKLHCPRWLVGLEADCVGCCTHGTCFLRSQAHCIVFVFCGFGRGLRTSDVWSWRYCFCSDYCVFCAEQRVIVIAHQCDGQACPAPDTILSVFHTTAILKLTLNVRCLRWAAPAETFSTTDLKCVRNTPVD